MRPSQRPLGEEEVMPAMLTAARPRDIGLGSPPPGPAVAGGAIPEAKAGAGAGQPACTTPVS